MNGRSLDIFAHFSRNLHVFVQLVGWLGGVITDLLTTQQNKKQTDQRKEGRRKKKDVNSNALNVF